MNQWQLAWRNLMRRKLRTILTLLSIVIGVASTFGVIAAVDTAKQAFPLYLKSAFGKADYSLFGTDAYYSESVLHEVRQLDHAESIAGIKQATSLNLTQEGITSIQLRVDLKGYSEMDTPLLDFRVIEGNVSSGGAVITDRTAKVWKAHVGDTISLVTDNGNRDIPIGAIVKYTAELMGPSSWTMAKYHPWTVAVPFSFVQQGFNLSGKVEAIQIKAMQGADAAALGKQLDDLAKRHDDLYMQPVILDFDSQFKDADTFFLALYIAGFLGITLSAVVIFNSMYVSIRERRGELATLKTIGYTSSQLQTSVLLEVAGLSVIGTAIGLSIGLGLATLLKAVIFMVFSVHSQESMELAKGFAISAAAGTIVPIAAALYPIRQAGKASVIAVLKNSQAEPKFKHGWRGIIGVLLIVSSFWIKHLLLVLPLLIGVTLLYPYMFRGFIFLTKPVYRLLFGFSGEVASRNLNRNLGRTSMTSVILCLGIAMIVLMSSLNSAIIQTYERVIYSSYGGNLDIMLHHIEDTDLDQLRRTEGVADAQTYPLQSVVWDLMGQKRKLPVYGVGADWIDRFPLFTYEGASRGDLIRGLGEDELVLDRIAFQVWGGRIGDTVTLETLNGKQAFKVVAVVDTMKNDGYGAFMSDGHFRARFGLKYERNALVLKDERTSPLQLRENVFNQFGVRIESMFGPEDWVAVVGANITGAFSVVNFLIVLSILISGMGITNTLLMNIMERIRELGMMRAVGVTRKQVVRMVLLEGFGIGLASTVIGCLFGIVLLYMTSTFIEIFSLTNQFGVSWLILGLIAAFGLVISLISSFTPATRASKTRLSEALRYE
ncbi:FtsX-like permease family protein [Paenibacillus sp. HJGM_3]|uniref:FtsX-like permease family protein n=1 Tax=Paenibacillus sp. HJGM_3 TaxID=3379816 RepID=UPI00385E6258